MADPDTSPAALRALAEQVETGRHHGYEVAATLRALAAEKEAGAPAPDGWIPWEGGECPISASTVVEVKYREGGTGDLVSRDVAGLYMWNHSAVSPRDDIIAYRISRWD